MSLPYSIYNLAIITVANTRSAIGILISFFMFSIYQIIIKSKIYLNNFQDDSKQAFI